MPIPPRNAPGLVLTVDVDERIIIDDGRIVITMIRISDRKARLHFAAAKDIRINRECVQELLDAQAGEAS